MSLADRLGPARHARRGCKIADITSALDEKDREILDGAWASHSSEAIAQALTDDGHPVAASTVTRHRRGRCSCGTE